jgi:hypothetical protein
MFLGDGPFQNPHEPKGALAMKQSIRWESDFGLARSMAKVQEKLVMIDFFNPG